MNKRRSAPTEPGSQPPRQANEDRSLKHTRRAGYKTMPAGKFKPACLSLMDQVKETGVEIVITKHNKPVARLAPVTDQDLRPFVGRSSGVIHVSREDLLAPVGEDWEVDADL